MNLGNNFSNNSKLLNFNELQALQTFDFGGTNDKQIINMNQTTTNF